MENNIGADPTQQPLVSQSSPRFSKTFIILIILILIIAVGAGGYFLGVNQSQVVQNQLTQTQPQPTSITQPSPIPTADPTAGWKIYVKDNLWEFKYPESWYLIDEQNTSVSFSDGRDAPRGQNVGYIYVQVASSSSSSYDDLFNKEIANVEKGPKLTITIAEKFNVNGYPAVKVIEESSQGAATEPSYTVAVYVKGQINTRISALSLRDKEEFNRTYLPIFDQILSTFKFTK